MQTQPTQELECIISHPITPEMLEYVIDNMNEANVPATLRALQGMTETPTVPLNWVDAVKAICGLLFWPLIILALLCFSIREVLFQ
jgi:hypothetical protein